MLYIFCRLKTVSLVVKHSQNAEALVKAYESKLYEEDAMNSDVKSIETVISTLKVNTLFGLNIPLTLIIFTAFSDNFSFWF